MSGVLQTFGSAFFVVMVCAPNLAWSQANSQSDNSATPKERFPKVIYIEKNGEVLPIGDISWEQLDELARAKKDESDFDFAVTSLSMQANATANLVSIRTKIEIQLHKPGTYRVPIQLGDCHFLTQPKIANPDTQSTVVARFDESRSEYDLLIECEKAERLTIEFPTEKPLRQIGNRKLLRLSLPRVAVSQFQLEVPAVDVEGYTVEGMTVAKAHRESTTEFQINGLVPQFELWWQPIGAKQDSKSFSVVSQIDADVNDFGEVTRVISLEANSYSLPLDGFTVRLPTDAEWDQAEDLAVNVGYSINSLGLDEGRENLQIVFDEPKAQPVPVRLRIATRKKSDGSDQSRTFDLSGFEVIGANSQTGTVRIISVGSWLLEYDSGEFARRVSNEDEETEATFEYSRPGQIALRVSRQTAELIVEPVYLLEIEEATARLTAIFKCTRRGARVTELDVDMGNWIFQSLGPDPDGVVMQIDELLAPTDGTLRLPLDNTTDQFEVTLIATKSIDGGLPKATQPIASEDGSLLDSPDASELAEATQQAFPTLEVNFPGIRNTTTLLPSLVALMSDTYVVATPGQTDAYVEVAVPERVRAEIQSDDDPICLRTLSMGQPAILPIIAAQLERTTHIDIETQIIDIDPNRIRIREQMHWRVTDVPLSRALLTMHQTVHDFGSVEMDVNGQSVVFSRAPVLAGGSSEYRNVQVPVPTGVGSFDLTVTYDWTRWSENGTVLGLEGFDEFDVDLVLPKSSGTGRADQMSVRNAVRKPRIANYDVSLTVNRNLDMDWPWSLDTPDPDIEAFSDEEPNILPITTRKITTSSRTTTFQELVDRAWFQTWYTKNARSDRAVFRVQGGDEDLQIEIPASHIDNLTVWVDGVITEFRRAGDNLIDVSVDADQPSHVVELHTTMDRRKPIGQLTMSLPRIAGADVMGQWYWHVVMPRNECMVTWPRKLTRAHSWDWSSVFPRRKSEMTLTELENWSGAIHSGGKIHTGSSEYLFGAMGEPDDTLSVRTAPLPVYVLVVTGSVFLIGLLMVYSKRRELVLVLLGLVICALIFLHPSYASVAGQMAALGIVLALLVQLLLWLLQHTPPLVAPAPDSAAPSWIRRIDRQSEGETTTLESGSSRYRSAQ